MLKFIDVLPNNVAIPINLDQRRMVATKACDVLFKRWWCFRRFVFRRFRRVDIGARHEQVAIVKQSPVARLNMAEGPAMDYTSINVDKVRRRVAMRGEQRIAFGRETRPMKSQTRGPVDGPSHS